MFNWCLCCWTGIDRGHQAQASELSAYSISWFQKAGESSCCVSLQLSLLKRMNCSFGKQMHVLFQHAALGYSLLQFLVTSEPRLIFLFRSTERSWDYLTLLRPSGIRVPLPRSLKLGIHKSVISETHYWDVRCFTSAQPYRTARADSRHTVCYKGKICCHETSSTKI